ncbi:hypothetical protein [Vibrio hippocampi]|uniref:Uncharacterized protein n=1 Tax=Vibrio hippocampi TaxID=654686 RepID=A0ABM8ZDP8_9VIBR|nr:hypothetical protein [Vibrio hippocampi]CAH0524330.1 hypothetical protein VHP8226_00144 [Vibrio hippocampi]
MTKRLCKYRRVEISAQLGEITQLVAQPKYMCGSCTRVASHRSALCKPRLLETATVSAGNSVIANSAMTPLATTPRETDIKADANHTRHSKQDKRAVKAAKKALKKQSKAQKKLAKLVKKSQKLAKQQRKLELKYQHLAHKADKRVANIATQTQLH